MDIMLFFVLIAISYFLISGTASSHNGGTIFLAHIGSAASLGTAIYFFGPALEDAAFWIQNLAMLGSLASGVLLTFTSMFRVSQFS